jgi:hypothetical protein
MMLNDAFFRSVPKTSNQVTASFPTNPYKFNPPRSPRK